jgi:hypothetical protein
MDELKVLVWVSCGVDDNWFIPDHGSLKIERSVPFWRGNVNVMRVF